MTASPTLAAAAGASYDNLNLRYIANQLKTQLTLFSSQNINLFPESQLSAHPVSNWLAIIAAIAQQLPNSNITLTQLTQSAEAVYRLCWVASFLQSVNQITTAQGNTLLASYNSLIAFP